MAIAVDRLPARRWCVQHAVVPTLPSFQCILPAWLMQVPAVARPRRVRRPADGRVRWTSPNPCTSSSPPAPVICFPFDAAQGADPGDRVMVPFTSIPASAQGAARRRAAPIAAQQAGRRCRQMPALVCWQAGRRCRQMPALVCWQAGRHWLHACPALQCLPTWPPRMSFRCPCPAQPRTDQPALPPSLLLPLCVGQTST